MTKTLSFKKCIAVIVTLAMVFALAIAGMGSTARANAATESGAVSEVNTGFDTSKSLGSWSKVTDSEANSEAYTTVQSDEYDAYKFGSLESLISDYAQKDFAIVKTSEKSEHANESVVAGFTSPSFTLTKDSYYKISVNLNAKASSSAGGAVVKLNGYDDGVYMTSNGSKFLNTAVAGGEQKWIEYALFVETSQFEEVTATLSLTLGDGSVKCKGFAAFDSVYAEKISAYEYAKAKAAAENNPALKYTFSSHKVSGEEIVCDFDSLTTEVNPSDWENMRIATVKMAGPTSAENDENNVVLALKANRTGVDANGKVEYVADAHGSVKLDKLVFDFDKFSSVNHGLYMVSFYAKANTVNGSSSAILHYKSKTASNYKDSAKFSISSMFANANLSSNGWSKNYFFVKSSVVADFEGYLEFDFKSDGEYFIDNISVMPLTLQQYSDYAAAATNCSMACDFNSLTDSTGLNRHFYNISEAHTSVLRPASWSVVNDNENVTYELVAKNSIEKTFHDSDLNNPIGNVVKIASEETALYTIESTTISVPETEEVAYRKISVYAGGHNLTLGSISITNDSGATLGVIEIKNDNPAWYTFELKTKAAASLNINISLGKDAFGVKTQASGNLYVAKVDYTDSTKEAYDASAHKLSVHYDSFDDYTLYDDADKTGGKYSFIKNTETHVATVTGKNVEHGIAPIDDINQNNSLVGHKTYSHPDAKPFGELNRVYAISANNTNGTISFNDVFTMTKDTAEEGEDNAEVVTVYKISVTLRAVIILADGKATDYNAITLGVKDTNAYATLSEITVKDTRKFNEDNQLISDKFVKYSFFVKLASSDTSASVYIKFGGEQVYEKASALVYISDISCDKSSELAYTENFESAEKDVTMAFKDLGETAENEEETEEPSTETYTDASQTWYIVPSIILALAVVIAVLGFVIKKQVQKAKAKKPAKEIPSNKPAYAKRIDYSKKNNTFEKKPEVILDDFDEDEEIDLYGEVTEVKTPDELDAQQSEEATATEESSEISAENTEEAPAEETNE